MRDDQVGSETHSRRVIAPEGGGDHVEHNAHPELVAPTLINTIIELWRRRQAWHQAEKRLTLQASALCRRYCSGDKVEAQKMLAAIEAGDPDANQVGLVATMPLLAARHGLEKERKSLEKELIKQARQLPVSDWCEAIPGVGPLALPTVVGEAGDLANYHSVAALWKRFGLAPIRGHAASTWRMKAVKGESLSGDEWTAVGYAPRRRSAIWNVGNGLIGKMGNGPRPLVGEDIAGRDDWSPYQQLFVARLRTLAARDVEEYAREPVARKGQLFESFSKHAAASAKRYVEKRFLRNLYLQWNRLAVADCRELVTLKKNVRNGKHF